MSLWAVEVRNLGRLSYLVEPEVLRTTVKLYVVGHDRWVLFVFGIIPVSLVARRGFIWVSLTEQGNRAPRSVWRSLRRLWPQFLAQVDWKLFAFTKRNASVEQRFMEFFGMQPHRTVGEHVFYEEVG